MCGVWCVCVMCVWCVEYEWCGVAWCVCVCICVCVCVCVCVQSKTGVTVCHLELWAFNPVNFTRGLVRQNTTVFVSYLLV